MGHHRWKCQHQKIHGATALGLILWWDCDNDVFRPEVGTSDCCPWNSSHDQGSAQKKIWSEPTFWVPTWNPEPIFLKFGCVSPGTPELLGSAHANPWSRSQKVIHWTSKIRFLIRWVCSTSRCRSTKIDLFFWHESLIAYKSQQFSNLPENGWL